MTGTVPIDQNLLTTSQTSFSYLFVFPVNPEIWVIPMMCFHCFTCNMDKKFMKIALRVYFDQRVVQHPL